MPEEYQFAVNGVDIAVYEWAGAGTPILFVHATGFHSRCWDQVIARLNGRRCFGIDLRGHGCSSKPPPPYHWRDFGEDVAAVAQALELKSALAVGHSSGGHAITYAAAHHRGLFASLLLIDPVILPEAFYIGVLEGEHFAAKRRADWDSPEEMFARFKDRDPFNRWNPAVLRDYCTYGLLPKPGGGYTLACPPAVEASIYQHASAANVYTEVAQVMIPVTVIRAGGVERASPTDFSASPTAPDLASRFPCGADVYLPEQTHFVPMEAPELIADHVRRLHAQL
jgi:pimeloyl-ACP methyl ester carboxylesterase